MYNMVEVDIRQECAAPRRAGAMAGRARWLLTALGALAVTLAGTSPIVSVYKSCGICPFFPPKEK